jgi:GTP-binding protein LepA
MVFSGLYPLDGSEYPALREALDKLRLNDARWSTSPRRRWRSASASAWASSGLLHLEIVRERLEREAGLALISTAPNVVYTVRLETGEEVVVTNPSDWPGGKIAEIREPVAKAMVLLPSDYVGAVMELCQNRRGCCRAWTTCPRTASSCATCCPWARSSSTSSTS